MPRMHHLARFSETSPQTAPQESAGLPEIAEVAFYPTGHAVSQIARPAPHRQEYLNEQRMHVSLVTPLAKAVPLSPLALLL